MPAAKSLTPAELWLQFAETHELNEKQLEQFQKYYELLIASNENFNLTAITELKSVLAYHFSDSLALAKAFDMSKISALADIGTGAGFPGIPLKIKYPHLYVVLVEVTHKKREFLFDVREALGLEGLDICDLDWRTFLRKTDDTFDLICARASLQPGELLRMFKPSSPYKCATLVYWAAIDWQPYPEERLLLERQVEYEVRNKKRKLVIWRQQCS